MLDFTEGYSCVSALSSRQIQSEVTTSMAMIAAPAP